MKTTDSAVTLLLFLFFLVVLTGVQETAVSNRH